MNTSKSLLWDFGGKIVNQIITFSLSIILARLLMPSDFALIGIIVAIISVSNVFIDIGLGNALIQAKKIEEVHLSSVFWINFIVSIILCCLLYSFSGKISSYYGYLELEDLIKVMSFTFLVLGISGIYRNILRRNIEFNILAKVNILSSVLSSIIAIYFAYNNYGVWALVIQTYVYNIVGLVILIFKTKWYPKLVFKYKEIKDLLNFGKKIFLIGLIDSIYQKLDIFVIGKIYSASALGFYSRGKSLNQLIGNFSSNSLSTVLFSVLSKSQNNIDKSRAIILTFFNITSYISLFIGGLLYLISSDLIVFMFTDKWLETVPLFKIMVLTTFYLPLTAIMNSAIKGLGKSELLLKLEIFNKCLVIPVYVLGYKFGLTYFLYGFLIHQILAILTTIFIMDRLKIWNFKYQVVIILKHILISLISVFGVLLIQQNFEFTNFGNIIFLGTLFSILFVVISLLLKEEEIKNLYNRITKIIKK
jgi:teichuronic acid exporter